MDDVLVVGAGPAGAVAATVLARAGARVRIIDRAEFPRPKLCGDTLNPGTLSLLARLRLLQRLLPVGRPVEGMRVTGEGGVDIVGRYPRGLRGLAILRSDLDWVLLQEAMKAGAVFEPGVRVIAPTVGERRSVEGVIAAGPRRMTARVTIAADGRASSLVSSLGLVRASGVRRWAVGGYYAGVEGGGALGEMHIRRGRYIGVAPVTAGLTNVCVVTTAGLPALSRDAAGFLTRAIRADATLADRFARARLAARPVVLGPLAVDARPGTVDGLLVAGDAAGFIDPMTGDGLRFAIRGGELAADAALSALDSGWLGVHAGLAARRRLEFSEKLRFNRLLRGLVSSPTAIAAATAGARLAPGFVRALVARAGDCDLAL
jgi:flavin-dependent dehydrogenase